jgi:2-dehydro-3-deoxyglucarate aldolase/4-hydroxy-2-oxoheptanedioate aldolase
MESANRFREKIQGGGVCLGAAVSFGDPTVSEVLCGAGLDFLWIDMEHAPLSMEDVQAHVMAAELSGAAPLVRVPWNDPVAIKQVLDLGAAGIIVPMVRRADEARGAVAACRYPPEGIRGWGPRRPSNYGRIPGPQVCEFANQSVLTVVQIEHIDAVRHLDEILDVPGLDGIYLGTGDLAASMGVPPETAHPAVEEAIATVIRRARAKNIFAGLSVEDDVEGALAWIDNGVQWLAVGDDFRLLARMIDRLVAGIRRGRP